MPQAFLPSPLPTPKPLPKRRLCPSRHRPHLSTPPPNAGSTVPSPRENSASTPDWRVFRAHLIAANRTNVPTHHHDTLSTTGTLWAHRLPNVEVGAVLLARPTHVWPRAFAHLDRAVVLITDVGENEMCGLLLNRPTRYCVGEHGSVLARVGRVFERNVVHLGGDCSTGSLEVLHGVSPDVCEGAREVVRGVYRGGFNASRELVGSGRFRARDFRFFVAYSKWTWEQFEAEVERGAWYIACCSPELVVGRGVRRGGEGLWEDVFARLPVER